MRYLCLVYVDREIIGSISPERNQKLQHDVGRPTMPTSESRGLLIMGEPLAEPETAVTVRRRSGKITVLDGPFAETKEHLGGFMLIEARDLNEAIDIARNDPMAEMGAIEVRALWDYVKGVQKSADLDAIYRAERGRVLATLIRLLGGFELAEEALHDAFAAAAVQWPKEGMPRNPRAWLVSAGRFRAIDRVRRRVRFDKAAAEIARQIEDEMTEPEAEMEAIADDYAAPDLHLLPSGPAPGRAGRDDPARGLRPDDRGDRPRLPRDARRPSPSASSAPSSASATTQSPTRSPTGTPCPSASQPVLQAIYLVFNEGYSAGAGDAVVRAELTGEAIRLARLLNELLPEPEVQGLLALMLLHEARRTSRTSPEGDLILLADQDRSLWNRSQIAEGAALVDASFNAGAARPLCPAGRDRRASRNGTHRRTRPTGPRSPASTTCCSPASQRRWSPSTARWQLPSATDRQAGLALIDAILAAGDLADYQPAHAARAELLRRLGRTAEARAAYEQALALTKQEPERRFLNRRLAALG